MIDLGLLVGAFLFGLRHGVDWDHIAAISDITAAQDSPRQGLWYGTLYASGHASVVFVLGVAAILLGDRIPDRVDEAMGRVVGVTLVLFGAYVLASLVRQRQGFRFQSRWMLIISGARRLQQWVIARFGPEETITHDHEHESSFHHDGDAPSHGDHHPTHGHHHQHTSLPSSYGSGTVLAVGALHGVGAETPTQVLVFLVAAGAGGVGVGIAVLIVFIAGLFAANSAITVGSAFGFVSAARYPWFYFGLAAVTAVVSLAIGTMFLSGRDVSLPALFGG